MGCCLTAVAVVFILLAIAKILMKLTIGWDRSTTCLIGKTTIVTGANSGIGFYTAQEFAKRGARVILACRDKNRAETAREKIIEATGNPNVVVRIVDFASLTSVREFAKEILKTEERLDILVNNAGTAGLPDEKTSDGLNILMQVNHFGPFLLTHLLIDLLKKSAPSRIINVASAGARNAILEVSNLNSYPKTKFPGIVNYSNTKLCNILFTNELARKLRGTGIVTNSLHPGAVNTELFKNAPAFVQFLVYQFFSLFIKTSEEGAQTSIYLALSKDVEGVTGEYFDNCRIAWLPGMPKIARDEGFAKKIWEKSEELVKLTAGERLI